MSSLLTRRWSSKSGLLMSRLLVVMLVIGVAAFAAAQSGAAPGSALRAPAPLQTEIAAGPWRLTTLAVATGDEADALVAEANAFNKPPGDGLHYVAVQMRAVNVGSTANRIEAVDFGVIGSAGLLRRTPEVIPPDPAFEGKVASGGTLEGWVVGIAGADETNLVLVFDSVTLTGNWADVSFAISDGAALAPVSERAKKTNKLGREPEAPVGIGTEAITAEWIVELEQVVFSTDVIGLFADGDYRTTALLGDDIYASDDSAAWIAILVKVTNNRAGNEIAYLPVSAFSLADGDGNPVADLSTLTAPNPEAAGYYYPGASREGWVLFDAIDYGGALIQFLPYRTDHDARYLTWDGGVVNTEPSFEGTLATGTKVRTTEDLSRLRKSNSTSADIVEELPAGTVLTITGAPKEGDDFTWYPVTDDKTGKKGYIAAQLIEPVE